VRDEFRELVELGPLPAGDALGHEQARQYTEVIDRLPGPPTADEAAALVGLLPPDESTSFGLAWSLVHTVESSPEWPVWEALDGRNWWRTLLRERLSKG
jgi:hypothetical protein